MAAAAKPVQGGGAVAKGAFGGRSRTLAGSSPVKKEEQYTYVARPWRKLVDGLCGVCFQSPDERYLLFFSFSSLSSLELSATTIYGP